MSRKNFLFANTPGGAKSSAIYFSLIETAKENGLDPYRYLTWVLKAAPKLKEQNQFDELVSTLHSGECSGRVPGRQEASGYSN